MKLRNKLFLKAVGYLIPFEFLWFMASMGIGFYFNELAGRTLAGIGFILIPFIGAYFFIWRELLNDEEEKFQKWQNQQKIIIKEKKK